MSLSIYMFFLVICLFLSAFFSGAETAFFSLSPFHRDRLQNRRTKANRIALSLVKHPRKILSTVLSGNTLVNITATSILTTIISYLSPGNAAKLAVPIMTVLLLVFGEITPKVIAVRWNLQIAILVAPILDFFSYLLMPFRLILERASFVVGLKEEIKRELDEADIRSAIDFLFQGRLSSPIKQALLKTLEIDKVSAEKIGIPVEKCLIVPGSKTVGEIRNVFLKSNLRFVVVDNNSFMEIVEPSLLVGVESDTPVADVCSPVLRLSRKAKLSSVLGRMVANNTFWALLVDRYDNLHSVIGLKQILSFLVQHKADE